MWDVVYVLDASTSMGKESRLVGSDGSPTIEAVKRAIVEAVRTIRFPFGSRVGVVGYRAVTKSGGLRLDMSQEMVQEVLPLTAVKDLVASPERLRDTLDQLKVGGATPTGEGIKGAIELLYTTPDEGRKRIKRLILVTDERSNAGPNPEKMLDSKLARRAIIDVIAIGSEADRRFFHLLASRTGGRFTLVNSASDLPRAFDPGIPYSDSGPSDPLLEEADRVSKVLAATDPSSSSFPGISNAARAVVERLTANLGKLIILENQSKVEFDLALSGATNDPKWPVMSMREYSDRIWSRAAEFLKLQALDVAYRAAIDSLEDRERS